MRENLGDYCQDPLPRGFKLVGSIALAAMVSGLLIAMLSPPAKPKPQPADFKTAMAAAFEAVREQDSHVRIVPIIRRSSDRPPQDPAPTLVTTTIERVAPPQAAQEAAAEPEPEAAPERRRHTEHRRHFAEAGDICTRHGLRKVITDNGRGWRCRR